MDRSVFQLILIFVVKDYAMLIQETHNWSLPTRRPQKVYDDVKEPILQ
jgi:hypothetical protein